MSLTSTSSGSSASNDTAASPLCTKREAKPSAAKTSHSISHVTGSSSTIIRRGWSGSISYNLQSRHGFERKRKGKAKRGAVVLLSDYLDFSTMFNGNLVGDCQTKAASSLFRRPH